jgi:DNA-binding CsgD family transcriptional regulator
MTYRQWKPSVGVLLLDAQLRLVYHTVEAAAILDYPRNSRESIPLDRVLPATRSQLASSPKAAAAAALIEFPSGRRRYRCRAFLLDAGTPSYGGQTSNGQNSHGNGSRYDVVEPKIAVVLERVCTQSPDITRWSETFQLTSRECETVTFLLQGLSSKEIGDRMRISPNTVKSFLKLVMAKVGASNRTGIIAKILEGTRVEQAPLAERSAPAAMGAACMKRSVGTIGIRSPVSSAARRSRRSSAPESRL